MGLSFLKRKKKANNALVLQDEADRVCHSVATDYSVSHLAVPQPATPNNYASGGASHTQRSAHQEFSVKSALIITPTTETGITGDGDPIGQCLSLDARLINDTPTTTPTTTAQTPPSSRTLTPAEVKLISPPNTQDDTPLHSNQSVAMLGKNVTLFSYENSGEGSSYNVSGNGPGLPTGESSDVFFVKKGKKKKKIKKTTKKNASTEKGQNCKSSVRSKSIQFFLIQPSKRDTAPISPKRKNADKEELENTFLVSDGSPGSRYLSRLLEHIGNVSPDNSRDAGVELELSLDNSNTNWIRNQASGESGGPCALAAEKLPNPSGEQLDTRNLASDIEISRDVGTFPSAGSKPSTFLLAGGRRSSPILASKNSLDSPASLARKNLKSLFDKGSGSIDEVDGAGASRRNATGIQTGARSPARTGDETFPRKNMAALAAATPNEISREEETGTRVSNQGNVDATPSNRTPPKEVPVTPWKTEAGLGYLSSGDKRFLSRLRLTSSKKQLSQKKKKGRLVAEVAEFVPARGTSVPEFITGDDDQTMPSLLTEPESVVRRMRTSSSILDGGGATPSRATPPNSLFSSNFNCAEEKVTKRKKGRGRHKDGGRGGWSRVPSPLSLAELVSGEEESGTYDSSETYGGTYPSSYRGYMLGSTTAMSAASAAGGIEKLLGVFKCNEDTTLESAVHNVLQCERTCGIGQQLEKDIVDLMLEDKERFAKEFQSNIIRNGVKLIYHESPSCASTNPDWIQSTVKLFIRPGSCHGMHLKQPVLAWAVLPVVSRTKMVRSFDASEDHMWSHLELLDVHSVLIDEGGEGGGSGDDSNVSRAATSTGFFSITATDGSVHVFEATSSRQRDYVVDGLRAVVARLTYHMVAGNTDVMGELYGEDVGALTGELPSLVSPWRALGKATHAFLDRQ